PAHILEGELAVIRGADTDPRTFDDLPRDLAEAGPPMHPAFQHDVFLLPRVDAEAEEAIEVVRLHMVGDQHDLGAAGIQHDRWPHAVLDAGPHRSAIAKAAIGDGAHAS